MARKQLRLTKKQALVYAAIITGTCDFAEIRAVTGLSAGQVNLILAWLEARKLITAEERFAQLPRYRRAE